MTNGSLQKCLTGCATPAPIGVSKNTVTQQGWLILFPKSEGGFGAIWPVKTETILWRETEPSFPCQDFFWTSPNAVWASLTPHTDLYFHILDVYFRGSRTACEYGLTKKEHLPQEMSSLVLGNSWLPATITSQQAIRVKLDQYLVLYTKINFRLIKDSNIKLNI